MKRLSVASHSPYILTDRRGKGAVSSIGIVVTSEEGEDDDLGGAQEVANVEGSVLNLTLEIVDLGQERVGSVGIAGSTERVEGAVDEVLELGKDLAIDHNIAGLYWLRVETPPVLYSANRSLPLRSCLLYAGLEATEHVFKGVEGVLPLGERERDADVVDVGTNF